VARVRGSKLQALRKQLFAEEPLCRECRKHGLTRAASIRDHIKPLAEGGTDAPSNIQPLCGDCSRVKTQEESKRGRERVAR
jgi:5-methylcytosine-specific restriction enzyme A